MNFGQLARCVRQVPVPPQQPQNHPDSAEFPFVDKLTVVKKKGAILRFSPIPILNSQLNSLYRLNTRDLPSLFVCGLQRFKDGQVLGLDNASKRVESSDSMVCMARSITRTRSFYRNA